MKEKKGWVLVTGAAQRVGKQIALALAQEGYSTVIHYNTSLKLAEETANECRKYQPSEVIQGDFSSHENLLSFCNIYLEKFPLTSGLVNNVGNFLIKNLEGTTYLEWSELFMTNLNAPFQLSMRLVPSIKRFKGSIINLGTSGLNSMKAFKDAPAYALTKLALHGLTVSLAKELAKDEVRVNMVSPGVLDIAVDLEFHKNLPMGRPGTAKEVAQSVVFLMREENRYITGQNIEVAGAFAL